MKRAASAIATWAVRWRWLVVILWLVATAGAVILLPSLGSVIHNDTAALLPTSSPSVRSAALASPLAHDGPQSGVLIAVNEDGSIGPVDQRAISLLEQRVRDLPGVTSVTPGSVSVDGNAETGTVDFSTRTQGGGSAGSQAVAAVRAEIDRPLPQGLHLHLTGSLPELVDQQHAANRTAVSVSLLSVLMIFIILALTLRALLAPLIVLFPAGLALALAGPLVAESTKVGVQISSLLELLLTALILGAGTDYGLFLLYRYRENVGRGLSNAQAIVEATVQTGGTVIFSAITVVASLLVLLMAHFGLYRGIGPGLALGILVVLVVDLTLVPALLSIFGSLSFWPSRPNPRWNQAGLWGSIAARVCRRPVPALLAGTVALGALSLAFLAYQPSGFNTGGEIPGSDSAIGFSELETYFGVTTSSPTDVVFRLPYSVWHHPQVLSTLVNKLSGTGQFSSISGPIGSAPGSLSSGTLATIYSRLGPPEPLPVVEPSNLAISGEAYDVYRATAAFITAGGHIVLFSTSLEAGSAGSTAALQAIPGIRLAVHHIAVQVRATAYGVAGEAPAAADVSALSGQDVRRVLPVVLGVLAILLALGLNQA